MKNQIAKIEYLVMLKQQALENICRTKVQSVNQEYYNMGYYSALVDLENLIEELEK